MHRASRNRMQIQAALHARLMTKLALDLAHVRTHPSTAIADFVKTALARFLSQKLRHLPFRRRMRFARSANRRDPQRSLVSVGIKPATGSGTGMPNADEYALWVATEETRNAPMAQSGSTDPVICFVIPVEQTEDWRATLDTLVAQSDPLWRAALVVKTGLDPQTQADLKARVAADHRLTLTLHADLKKSLTTTFVAPLQAGDCLAPDAVRYLTHAMAVHTNAQIIYGDDDRLEAGIRTNPRFKNGWNRDLLYSLHYIGRFAVLMRDRFEVLLDTNPDLIQGLTHLDMVRATVDVADDDIVSVPHILCHLGGSMGAETKTTRSDLEAFLQTHKDGDIRVLAGAQPGTFRVVWPLRDGMPSVCLIIPTRDRKALTQTAVDSILAITEYESFEILIVDNGSTDPETLAWFEDITQNEPRVRVLPFPGEFNYSAINNFGVENTKAEVIGLLNNDVEAIHADWLREMVSHAMRQDIGCVGAKLHFSDCSIQHAGVSLGIGPVAGHIFAHMPAEDPGPMFQLDTVRNTSAVTGACIVMRRALYEQVGGLDADNLVVACNDVDLCLKANQAGYRTLWTPFAALFHHESASRGQDTSPEQRARLEREQVHMIKTWDLAPGKDMYVNPVVFNWL